MKRVEPQILRITIRSSFCLTLFFLLFCIQATGINKNYIFYHKEIIKAEELFLKNEFEQSVRKYDSIFKVFEYKVFSRDYYNMLQIVSLSPNKYSTVEIIGYLKVGMKQVGINKRMLFRSRQLARLCTSNERIKNWIDLNDPILYKEYWKNKNKIVFEQLESLVNRDLKYRRLSYNEADDWKSDSIYFVGIDSNTLEFVDLVKQLNKIPGEVITGISYNDTVNRNYSLPFNGNFTMVCFHNRATFFLLMDFFKDGLQKGYIHPKQYALINDWAYVAHFKSKWQSRKRMSRVKFSVPLPQENIYNEFIDPMWHSKDLLKVHKSRFAIGLPSLAHEKNKRLFQKRTGLQIYHGWLDRF